MTKKEAIQIFNNEIKLYLPHDDKVAIRTAWNDYTDSLCKNGDITDRQYRTWVSPFK